MKSKIKSLGQIILVVLAVAFQSCSNEDDGVLIENENQLEDIQGRIEQYQESLDAVQAPDAMQQYAQQDAYASSAVLYLTSLQVQAITYSSVFLDIPGDAEQQSVLNKNAQNTNTWVWSYGGVTLYYTITSDANFDYFTYDIEENGVRRTFYQGKMSKDGNSYEVRFNGDNGEFLLMTYKKTGDTITFKIEDQNNDRIELVFNIANRSGSIKAYTAGVLSESFVWLTDGTGSYTNHITGETYSWP